MRNFTLWIVCAPHKHGSSLIGGVAVRVARWRSRHRSPGQHCKIGRWRTTVHFAVLYFVYVAVSTESMNFRKKEPLFSNLVARFETYYENMSFSDGLEINFDIFSLKSLIVFNFYRGHRFGGDWRRRLEEAIFILRSPSKCGIFRCRLYWVPQKTSLTRGELHFFHTPKTFFVHISRKKCLLTLIKLKLFDLCHFVHHSALQECRFREAGFTFNT